MNIQTILLILFAILLTSTNIAFAEHEALVAGEVIPLADASLSHGDGCDDLHYHGELNGKSDPDPDGCGHGVATILAHNKDDESIIPEKKDTNNQSSLWGKFTDWLDVAFQAISGGFSPKTVDDSVDIVEEATPSIKENIDTIEVYRETVPEDEDTLGIYNNLNDVPENPTISQRFFRWLNNLTPNKKAPNKNTNPKQESKSGIKIQGLEGLKTE